MAVGAGKYDDLCTEVRERLKARGCVVLVLGGERGDGFSAQLTPGDALIAAGIFNEVAELIVHDFEEALEKGEGKPFPYDPIL